jgi:nitrogen fixation protein NifZ
MMEPRTARYEWGQRVSAAIDLFNDGSFPAADEGALLVPAGGLGEIVQIGHHTEANVPIYLVEFGPSCVLGVLEDEIALAGVGPLATETTASPGDLAPRA